ncbi:hypothetical protein GCM10011519_18450 [Marmoricola endophyticus]|uniref:WXG100 family type VII secretion target n=1 Tax=Marmoricola endophyticus TaxID=2040280 RepID=A0A917BIK9_9ACTN|nr:WXG100 family type VII secretion target [Marmoricola endophyticus]GGF44924.1 hypothetical protein GCM10011519_18450 [Marmoricola endophyticus]
MAEVGGDLETLRTLHRGLGELGDQASEMKSKGDAHLHQTVWKGANSEKFRTAWEEFKPSFDRLQQALHEGRDDIRVQHNNIAAATGEPAAI